MVMELVRKELELVTDEGSDEGNFSWVLYFNRSANKSRGGAKIIVKGPEAVIVKHLLCFDFKTTNN